MSVHYGENPVRGEVANTAKPTRDFKSDGSSRYPGGRNLRRAEARLARRLKAFTPGPGVKAPGSYR